MVELIGYLKKSFAMHINDLQWMSSTTKVKALDKLNKFTVKVAYPDQWKDYSKLAVESKDNGGTLYKNLQNVTALVISAVRPGKLKSCTDKSPALINLVALLFPLDSRDKTSSPPVKEPYDQVYQIPLLSR